MKPNFLKKGDTISLVAPSFGCTTFPYNERLKKAINNLENLNYKLDLGENIFLAQGIVASNTAKKRGKEINKAFDGNSTAVLSAGGGELMVEMLEYVDFEKIKQNPKWFVGFSDNTNLTYTISTICDVETIYGICAPNFCNYPFEYDSKDTYDMLLGKTKFTSYGRWQYEDYDIENPFAKYHFDKRTKVINLGYTEPVEGKIIGGCLDCLVGLCGTKFDNTVNYINKYKDEGIIFFFEACDLNSVSIRRAITQLKYAGWFNNVKLLLIGRSNNHYDETFGLKMNDSIIDVIKDLNIPTLLNVDLGHRGPSIPIRCGASVKVSLNKNKLEFEYKN